ncbi:MAG: glycine cleavage system aminomethyltransferase GcvT [Actinomycetota bacterium]|nr:glycine cleavage system aminomethyltransferase GcvT [Actinomycetota bacterium]
MTIRPPLYDEHVRLGAKITPFGGWDMPLQYSGVISEHTAVREHAGLFDVSHLGKLIVSGEGAEAFLDGLLPGKVAALGEWRAGYNLVLNDDCGIIDDIFVYRRPDGFVVVPNASNSDAVKAVLIAKAPPGVSVQEGRERWAIIALSGPAAKRITGPHVPAIEDLKMHSFLDSSFEGIDVTMARTGYTGEYTIEFFVDPASASKLWNLLLDIGASDGLVPAGLGARDTLRLEMGFPLHGHEISEQTDPIMAGLGWVIQWEKSFEHKSLLQTIRDAGTPTKLVGLMALGREIPRAGYQVASQGKVIGNVVSGNYSPVLGKGIGLAYVESSSAEPGTILDVDVRGKTLEVQVTRPPFIKK